MSEEENLDHLSRFGRDVHDVAKEILDEVRQWEVAGRGTQGKKDQPDRQAKIWAVDLLYGCAQTGDPPPDGLIELVRHLLGVPATPEFPPPLNASEKAAQYLAVHPDAPSREVAKAAGCSKTTIGDWKKDKSFTARVALLRKMHGLATE